jgi:hypothetical protein
MFKAFFDESGDDVEVFLMAGWLAHFKEWEKFSEAWNTELKFSPSIKYFNHNEAMGLKCQFESWKDRDRDEKLMSLAGVIARHELVGIVGELSIPRFNALYGGSILPKKTLRSVIKFTEPYHHACQSVISLTLGYQVVMAKNFVDQVDFVFDEGVPFLNDCIANYPKLKKVLPEKAQAIAGTIVPGNDKHIVHLQAADMLAGQELIRFRTGASPAPLTTMGEGKITEFNSLPSKPLESIPRSISRMNVVWATKQLEKAKRTGQKSDEDKGKGEK